MVKAASRAFGIAVAGPVLLIFILGEAGFFKKS
jgi:hypothetical protein